ncbi:pyrimidine 5'-nucleotidase [Novosphingobium cyanobacteriorum]|uniref:Pyrimidine 5'-nucleotidase n=1 Tax=Novosphingobium cyanobacteriorum TaxID=3024215 RepID=A0ABT6CJ87_9SPHN|nr:pyrimidine 5'-nucleotidase [Novosphingobium cyanobacteriorum]MDF8333973.1 pyrimidine 5'-nucleotidase [Novosphingobium cyanobacteriorum]
MSFDPARVDCWIFDLDNTLYPAWTDLFGQIDVRMGQFISELLGCDATEARRVQKMYFHDHGTTLAGLMHYHAVDPHHFLDFVHDIDMTVLKDAPPLADRLMALPGRRLIFTNGDAPYATKVMDALGITHCFEGMWDIHAMEYRPKPEPSAYAGLIEAFGIDSERAVFVEDSARNLGPAKAMGMQTVWLDLATEWGDRAKDDAAIDVVIDDLVPWLDAVIAQVAT